MPANKNWASFFPEGKHGQHLFPAYAARAQAASAEVTRVPHGQAATETIINLLKDINAKRIVCVPETTAEQIGLVDALQNAGFIVHTKPDDIAKYASVADAGITEMEFAVAETGSCLENDERVEKRLCSALPPVHIGLLQTELVIASLPDAFSVLTRVFDGGCLSFITGPSRTADIERVLTIGMHGPTRMIPLFIDSLGGA